MEYNDLIFQCLYQITTQRDRRSLEKNLLKSIQKLLSVTAKLAIIHYHTQNHTYNYSQEDGGYKLSLCEVDEKLLECFVDGRLINEVPRDVTTKKPFRYLFPILSGQRVVAILQIHCQCLNQSQLKLLTNILAVYGNYVSVLLEGEKDTQTGLLNRKNLEDHFATLLHIQEEQYQLEKKHANAERRNARRRHSSWLVMLDIDHFKKVNDQFGHVIGDEVILILSQRMTSYFRRNDLIFRFGGEEFLLLLNNISEEQIFDLIERFRRHIQETKFPQIGHISISLGYTEVDKQDYSLFAIERADKALYWSKNNGRDQTTAWENLRDAGHVKERLEETSVSLF